MAVAVSKVQKTAQKPLVALTGATGFIGQYLLKELPKRGYHVRVLLRRSSVVPLDFASAVVGDLARPQNMTAALIDGMPSVTRPQLRSLPRLPGRPCELHPPKPLAPDRYGADLSIRVLRGIRWLLALLRS